MTWDEATEEFVLSTGRRFSANRSIIGIGNDLRVSEGYDGGVQTDEFTSAERRELADYMMGLWRTFAAAPPPPEGLA